MSVTTKVVAVRDDGAVVMNSLELGQSFTFNAKYTPPAALLFSLSILLTEQVTLHLRFPPGLVSSLEKNTCNENDDAHPPYFDIIQRHLHNCRSFTRLQFKLHSRGQLITPAGFVLSDYDTKARHTFALVTSLAAALAFSLYLPRDVLTNAKYQVFYQAWKRNSVPIDLRDMYNGTGGKLYTIEDQDRLLSSIPGAVVTTVATDPPSYNSLPTYSDEGQSFLLPPSQQSTTSESDTVAVPTPPGYRNENEEQLGGVKEHCSKRDWSSDSENTNQRGQWKRRAIDASPQPGVPSVTLDPLEVQVQREEMEQLRKNQEALIVLVKQLQEENCMLRSGREELQCQEMQQLRRNQEALEARMEKQEEETGILQSRNEEFEEHINKMERLQEDIADEVASRDAHVHELRQDHETLRELSENWMEEVKDEAKDIMEVMIGKHMQGKAEDATINIENDIRERLRRAFDD
ncbi:hypothetical protein PG984_009105 [Apiospora sp. TS-2023a]